MNKIRKIFIFICGLAVAMAISVDLKKSDTTLAAEVQENFTKLSELSVEQAMSSNPYYYINNEYYDNIVELGVPVVEVLEKNYRNGYYGGLNAYIAGLAIQDITNMNLYECAGIEWETAQQFFECWDTTIKDLPDIFSKIMNSDDTMANKVSSIEKFGIFGRYFLTSLANENVTTLKLVDRTVSVKNYSSKDLRGFDKLSAKEMEEVGDYLESRLK
ncbi:MAG: hypothetical protein U0L59_06625 [Faecalimonas sp.]|nr:hypothetical protein [Faecalimonas sp.]